MTKTFGSPADPDWAPWLCVPDSHRVCLFRSGLGHVVHWGQDRDGGGVSPFLRLKHHHRPHQAMNVADRAQPPEWTSATLVKTPIFRLFGLDDTDQAMRPHHRNAGLSLVYGRPRC